MHDPDRKTVLSAVIFSEAPDYGRLVPSLCSIDLLQHLALRTSALLEFASGARHHLRSNCRADIFRFLQRESIAQSPNQSLRRRRPEGALGLESEV
jgi:hypothetical protein